MSKNVLDCTDEEFKKAFRLTFVASDEKSTSEKDGNENKFPEDIFSDPNGNNDLVEGNKEDIKINVEDNNTISKSQLNIIKNIKGGKGNKKIFKVIYKENKKIPIKKKEKKTRIDYLKKQYKIQSNKCLLRISNSLLKQIFPMHKIHFLPLNYSCFTIKIEKKANLEFFSKKIKEILYEGKDNKYLRNNNQKKEKLRNSNQKENFKLIQRIEKIIREKGTRDPGMSELQELLDMTLEEFYTKKFQNSVEFQDFCNDENNEDAHVEFEKLNKYSLRTTEYNGYVRYMKE